VTTAFVWDIGSAPRGPQGQADGKQAVLAVGLDDGTTVARTIAHYAGGQDPAQVEATLPTVIDDGTQYVYGLSLLAQRTSSSWVYPLEDGLGSVVAVASINGTIAQTYAYDAFGKARTSSGSQPIEYQFAGQQTDATGLQYLRARYYDPTAGVLLSKDPYGNAVNDPSAHNPYSYATNNALIRADPSGKEVSGPGDGGGCWVQLDPSDARALQNLSATFAPGLIIVGEYISCYSVKTVYDWLSKLSTYSNGEKCRDAIVLALAGTAVSTATGGTLGLLTGVFFGFAGVEQTCFT
jgi:RHS repeat-associated protein